MDTALTQTHYDKYALQLARKGDQYQYYREITDHFSLDPGLYVIIPSTYDARVNADYLLRVYTDAGVDGKYVVHAVFYHFQVSLICSFPLFTAIGEQHDETADTRNPASWYPFQPHDNERIYAG